jgi:hypothetical protein
MARKMVMFWEKSCPVYYAHHKTHLTGLASNLGLGDDRPITNCLGHVTIKIKDREFLNKLNKDIRQ